VTDRLSRYFLTPRRLRLRLVWLVTAVPLTAVAATPRPLAAASPPACSISSRRPGQSGDDARASLDRAIAVVGLSSMDDRLRASSVTEVTSLDYQSDRPSPPYLWASREQRLVVAPSQGRVRLELTPVAGGPALINDGSQQVIVSPRGAQQVPLRSTNLTDERALDPWLVLMDWRRATDVRVDGRCVWRDRERLVLLRGDGVGAERLLLDPQHGYPIALERREPHYLWGDVHVSYSWAIWAPVAGSDAVSPMYAFRLVDGEVNLQRRHSASRALPSDSATLVTLPSTASPLLDAPLEPDTVRVSSNTFLLRTASYTNVVTRQRDTVFVLDAPVDADRARRDSAWIGRLFPGRFPIRVIVTDIAWPHIAGLRYWAAQGASIVTRESHRPFIDRVLQRRWTLAPDLWEARRVRRPAVRTVADGLDLAGGAVRVLPIDGVGSEGALMVFLPAEGFLWAGDYVQPGGPDSFSRVYAREVTAAVERAGLSPTRVAAMHFPLAAWNARPTR
jgi:hypothetical protein